MRRLLSKTIALMVRCLNLNYTKRVLGGRIVQIPYFSFVQRRAAKSFPNRELPFYKEMMGLVPKVDVLIDVGANQGFYAFEFAGVHDIKIIAVEPDPASAAIFQRIQADYFADCDINLCRYFVGSQDSTRKGALRNAGTGRAHFDANSGDAEVRFCSLDSLIKDHDIESHKIGLLIDVEGGEAEVIRGLRACKDRVSFIAIEIHQNFLRDAGESVLGVINMIQEKGFVLSWIRVPEKGLDSHGQTHAIFIRQ